MSETFDSSGFDRRYKDPNSPEFQNENPGSPSELWNFLLGKKTTAPTPIGQATSNPYKDLMHTNSGDPVENLGMEEGIASSPGKNYTAPQPTSLNPPLPKPRPTPSPTPYTHGVVDGAGMLPNGQLPSHSDVFPDAGGPDPRNPLSVGQALGMTVGAGVGLPAAVMGGGIAARSGVDALGKASNFAGQGRTALTGALDDIGAWILQRLGQPVAPKPQVPTGTKLQPFTAPRSAASAKPRVKLKSTE